MDDELRNLIAGDPDEQDEAEGLTATRGILDNLMGVLSGPTHGQPSQGTGSQTETGVLTDGGSHTASMGLGDLLGMWEGAQNDPSSQSASGSGVLGTLLGALTGGGQATPGLQSAGGIPGTSGIARALAERLGVSEGVANTMVSAAVGLVVSAVGRRASQRRAPETRGAPAAPDGVDLSDVLKTLGGRQGLDGQRLDRSGLPGRVAERAGVDAGTARRGIDEALRLLGNEYRGGQAGQRAA
jgi:hypothetical protein